MGGSIFPIRESAVRLLGAVLMERHELWTPGHCYCGISGYGQCRHVQARDVSRLRKQGTPREGRGSPYRVLCSWSSVALRRSAKTSERQARKAEGMVPVALHEPRPDVWPLLVKVFHREPGIELSQEATWVFNNRTDVDAIAQ